MNSSGSSSAQDVMYPCAQCYVAYHDYRHLLEHLYWRHGTESISCNTCNLKRWTFAEHICHVLPIYQEFNNSNKDKVGEVEKLVRQSPYCYCGKDNDRPMIGCDGLRCVLQWYHFTCVGIEEAPPGQWFCPECSESDKKQIKSYEET